MLLVLTLATLAAVVFQREPILASFRGLTSPSLFGPFEPSRRTGQSSAAWGNRRSFSDWDLLVTVLARRRPRLAGSAALVLMTADLAAANSRYVLTVPQSVV